MTRFFNAGLWAIVNRNWKWGCASAYLLLLLDRPHEHAHTEVLGTANGCMFSKLGSCSTPVIYREPTNDRNPFRHPKHFQLPTTCGRYEYSYVVPWSIKSRCRDASTNTAVAVLPTGRGRRSFPFAHAADLCLALRISYQIDRMPFQTKRSCWGRDHFQNTRTRIVHRTTCVNEARPASCHKYLCQACSWGIL